MGLDMYLHAGKYIGNWQWQRDTNGLREREQYKAILAAIGIAPEQITNEGSPHLYVEICVGYWRKANAIHKWFVDNVQDGTDNCGNYYVSREQLQELQNQCRMALEHKLQPAGAGGDVSGNVLPPQTGFFFGGAERDEWYYAELEYTIEMIDSVLSNPKLEGFEFQYHSSW